LFLIYTVLAFILLWLGLRWRFRRALLVAVTVGLIVDGLTDYFVTRLR
jgi:hypothetical protein